MPIRKGMRKYERRTDATEGVRSRMQIVEEIAMKTSPLWDSKKKKFVRPMTIAQACSEVGITDMTFRAWRQEEPHIKKFYEDVVASRKEMLHSVMEETALDNVMEVLGGSTKVRPMEKANLSMRYLEKTSPEFNQAIKLDVENKTNPVLMMSREELTQRIKELSTSLNLTDESHIHTIATESTESTTLSGEECQEDSGDGIK